jgi:LPXTG-motif cell wall-anchored protein
MGRAQRTIMTALALSTMLVLFGAAAGAADYPPSVPSSGHLTLPTTVAVKGMVDFSGTGCGATQPVTVAFNGATMRTVTSDAAGAVSGSFRVPSDTAPGSYMVSVANSFCSLSGMVTVLADPGLLPHTGSSNTIPIVLSALAAVAVGFTLVAAARRRRRFVNATD